MAMPMQPRPRPRPVGPPPGNGPSPIGPPPVGNVQAGAMDQYRNALLRRMQGGGQGLMPPPEMGAPDAQPMQPPQGGMQAPGMMGGAPGQEAEGGPDIGDIIKQLMGTRFSRRVLGGGPGR